MHIKEQGTSMMCNNCKSMIKGVGMTETFRTVTNPKDKNNLLDEKRKVICNGLVSCNNCMKLLNRDENSARNHAYLGFRAFMKLNRGFMHLDQRKNDIKGHEKKIKKRKDK